MILYVVLICAQIFFYNFVTCKDISCKLTRQFDADLRQEGSETIANEHDDGVSHEAPAVRVWVEMLPPRILRPRHDVTTSRAKSVNG